MSSSDTGLFKDPARTAEDRRNPHLSPALYGPDGPQLVRDHTDHDLLVSTATRATSRSNMRSVPSSRPAAPPGG